MNEQKDKTPRTADELINTVVSSVGYTHPWLIAERLEAMLRLAIERHDELAGNLGHSEDIEAFHEALAKLARGDGP